MSGLLYDVRDAVRAVRRAPGFTLVATLTLAVGIGANTAIFGMLDRLLLRGMPVEAPQQLVRVVIDRGEDGINHNLSYRTYTDLRAQRSAFAGVLASTSIQLGIGGSDGSTRVVGEAVSGDYFDVLGIRPAAGRWFAPDEDRVDTPEPVVVLSHSFWTRVFDTDPGIVGRTIRLNDRPFTVIGVAPEAFTGLRPRSSFRSCRAHSPRRRFSSARQGTPSRRRRRFAVPSPPSIPTSRSSTFARWRATRGAAGSSRSPAP